MRELLELGADVSITDNTGLTPLALLEQCDKQVQGQQSQTQAGGDKSSQIRALLLCGGG